MSKAPEQLAEKPDNNYWDKQFMGIAPLICADVHVLGIQFDLAISGRDWFQMTTKDRVAEFRRKFQAVIEPAMAEIENQVKLYEEYRYKKQEAPDELSADLAKASRKYAKQYEGLLFTIGSIGGISAIQMAFECGAKFGLLQALEIKHERERKEEKANENT